MNYVHLLFDTNMLSEIISHESFLELPDVLCNTNLLIYQGFTQHSTLGFTQRHQLLFINLPYMLVRHHLFTSKLFTSLSDSYCCDLTVWTLGDQV